MIYEVDLMLCREVTVTVEAPNRKEAEDVALDRNRWLSARGLRRRLRLLAFMGVRPVE